MVRMTYPYYHMFWEMLFGGALTREFHTPDLSRVPLLYIYGKSKNTMFHTPAGLAALDAAVGSSHVGLDNAAHWVYLQKEEECLRLVKPFLNT